jgi:hypothetical protein
VCGSLKVVRVSVDSRVFYLFLRIPSSASHCSLEYSSGVSDFVPESAAEIPSTPYAKQITTHLGQDHIDRLTQIFVDMGAAPWLEQYPFSRLELAHNVFYDGRLASGVYSYKTGILQIATTRAKSEYGYAFQWQNIYSVSSAGETQFQATQRTLVHELGHHLHAVLAHMDMELFRETTRAVILRGGTTYSRDNHLEYFAETFALYTFYPTELLVKDMDGYGMIELALERVGLEVKQQ